MMDLVGRPEAVTFARPAVNYSIRIPAPLVAVCIKGQVLKKMYSRSRPLMLSFISRYQEWCGSAKQRLAPTGNEFLRISRLMVDLSLPVALVISAWLLPSCRISMISSRSAPRGICCDEAVYLYSFRHNFVNKAQKEL